MNHKNRNGKVIVNVAILGFVGLATISGSLSVLAEDMPAPFDNQGDKIFKSYKNTPEANLKADSGDRNLMGFYELRQYPGSPPRIPHEVDLSFSGNETNCLSCHEKGGFSSEFGKFTPVTPHPEHTLCYQCHAQIEAEDLFVESNWKSVRPPRLGRSFLSNSPPAVPHSLQMRENCIACHTGPGAVAEIRIDHAARGDCRQCHAVVVQSKPLEQFER